MAVLNTAVLKSNITATTGEKVEVTNQSNISKTSNIDTDIAIAKVATPTWVLPLGKVTIVTTITNNTDVELSDFNIKDTLSEGASFVPSTLKIGSILHEDLDPIIGFVAPVTLGPGTDFTISYEIVADKYTDVNEISNFTKLEVEVDGQKFVINSSELKITVLQNKISLLKTATPSAVKSGDEITYTIMITNAGEMTNTDLLFTDEIPMGTAFVENSVKIDDIEKAGYNPADGFALDNLAANGSIKVEFKVLVN